MEYKQKVEMKTRIREAMDMRGMKAVDLCEQTGIPKSAISYYLAGKSEPKSERIYLISKALNVAEPWLMGYDVSMERLPEQKISDAKVDITKRIRNDNVFFEAVRLLNQLSPEQLAKITGIMELLCNDSKDKI